MSFVSIASTDITPTIDSTYQDVDVTAHVSADATGVVVELNSPTLGQEGTIVIRKNGSTDTWNLNIKARSHVWMAIGIDADDIFEMNIPTAASGFKCYMVGYFEGEATFFDNAVDSGIASSGAWTDVDISSDTGGDTSIAAIGAFSNTGTGSSTLGVRKDGSTDALERGSEGSGWIIGVDGSEVFEGYTGSYTVYGLKIVGYLTAGATFDDNATDVSLSSTGSYIDLTPLPAGALGGTYLFEETSSESQYHIRKNGESDDHYQRVSQRSAGAIMGCDGSGLVEAKISSTNCDTYQIGYFTTVSSRRLFSTVSINR